MLRFTHLTLVKQLLAACFHFLFSRHCLQLLAVLQLAPAFILFETENGLMSIGIQHGNPFLSIGTKKCNNSVMLL